MPNLLLGTGLIRPGNNVVAFMSPVSPVFHTVATMNIDLKNILREGNIHFNNPDKFTDDFLIFKLICIC